MNTDNLEQAKLAVYAREMGISVEELEELHYREDCETSRDGDTIFNHYIEFSDENPWRTMVKIKGLDGNVVRFQPWLFETEGAPD
ncbi:hypothetical protein [Rhizobium grahamii]|uniref:Uncharacterized protein n=1 Tax=Rhizobium grahamii CCGE 502 TaxID=990285 RepID=S3HLS8_9HYPH|nr:hypothetical protein [Rhizobium grahamii]EPE99554.1 hypothetical protein RGCCGE502_05205 [Rhizobium grahamii CCGE 502]